MKNNCIEYIYIFIIINQYHRIPSNNITILDKMSQEIWQTIVGQKQKQNKVKPVEPVKFDPIPGRQAKIHADQQAQQQACQQAQQINSNPNQDWNTIVLEKTKPKQKIVIPQRQASSIKINESDDTIQIKKVSNQMARAVIDARCSKKWSQVQLAHNSNIDIKTINEIERGGSVYDANVFNKLCKALGTTIERNYDLIQKN